MIASLIDKGNYYVCSNCMMKQQCAECTCWFCGRIFDNFEEEAIKEFVKENEGNIRGEAVKSCSLESK